MLSPRRTAQLGLSAACLTLVTCITMLVAGAKETGTANPGLAPRSNHITPVSTELPGMPTNITPSFSVASK
jgi:hypothetical protein